MGQSGATLQITNHSRFRWFFFVALDSHFLRWAWFLFHFQHVFLFLFFPQEDPLLDVLVRSVTEVRQFLQRLFGQNGFSDLIMLIIIIRLIRQLSRSAFEQQNSTCNPVPVQIPAGFSLPPGR